LLYAILLFAASPEVLCVGNYDILPTVNYEELEWRKLLTDLRYWSARCWLGGRR